MWKKKSVILFGIYCLVILWGTIFSRSPRADGPIVKLEFFWAYRDWIAGVKYAKGEAIQNIKNVLAFVPFGVLAPFKKWNVVLIAVLAFSGGIELNQYLFALGWCEVDDVICNTLGAMIGYWLWIIIKGKLDAAKEKTRGL